jgi:hypothetical protein
VVVCFGGDFKGGVVQTGGYFGEADDGCGFVEGFGGVVEVEG